MKLYRACNYLDGEPLEIMEMRRPFLTKYDVKCMKSLLETAQFFPISNKVEVFSEPEHRRIMIITKNGIER